MAPSPRDSGPEGPGEPGDGPEANRPLDDATVAERWAELTAELGELQPPAPDLPASSPDDGATGRPDDSLSSGAAPAVERFARPLGPRDYQEPDGIDVEESDTFIPPEPEPLGGSDPVLVLGWLATIGPLMLGLLLFVIGSPTGWLMAMLGAVLLCGVGLLLWRMPATREDDGPGNGAVV